MTLRTVLLSGAFALFAGSAMAADVAPWPAPAPAPMPPPDRVAMGYAELAYGWYNPEYSYFRDDDDDDLNVISAAGVANIPFGTMWNFELEAQGYSIYAPGNATLSSEVGGYGHLYWRDPAKWGIGAFAGYTNFTVFGDDAINKFLVGAEGLFYWNALTLYLQGAYVGLNSDGDGADGLLGRAAARYFVTPDFRLQGDIQYTSLDLPFGDSNNLALIGTGEFRLPNVPLSAFASYRWDNVDNGYAEYDSSTIKIGIRAYVGSDSLLDNDRNGAPLDVLPFEIGFPEPG